MTYELPAYWFEWVWEFNDVVFPKFIKSLPEFAVCHTISGLYGMYERSR